MHFTLPVFDSHQKVPDMATPSLRTLRGALRPSPPISFTRCASSYTPISANDTTIHYPSRPPRPSSPAFFTGKPTYHSAVTSLESALSSAQSALRTERIFPFPTHLPALQPPRASWHAAPVLGNMLGTTLKTSAHRRVVELLNELHMLRHVAAVCDLPHVYGDLQGVLAAYEREGAAQAQAHSGAAEGEGGEGSLEVQKEKESSVDEFGRAYGMGRRKDASARVWIIPSAAGRNIGSTSAPSTPESAPPFPTDTPAPSSAETSPTQVLINHLPLSAHFARSSDADIILRPLRLTGLLGAYNIFALTRGGGASGQAGAVALALSRALVAHRPECKDVLFRDGALMRDTRMVERKKTGKAKARKKVSFIWRMCGSVLTEAVCMGQAVVYIVFGSYVCTFTSPVPR